MLDNMTEQYCEVRDKTVQGYPRKTCQKALSVFYATCKKNGWDYTKPRPKTREHLNIISPIKIVKESLLETPLRVRGIAITTGMSRNYNIYTREELEKFADKLLGAPMYIEHVTAFNAIGKVTNVEWDGTRLWYEAEIYDEEVAEKIKNGLIKHVSIGADYETVDIVDGLIPHGLHNAELSLVAVAGVPEANIFPITESLKAQPFRRSLSDGAKPKKLSVKGKWKKSNI